MVSSNSLTTFLFQSRWFFFNPFGWWAVSYGHFFSTFWNFFPKIKISKDERIFIVQKIKMIKNKFTFQAAPGPVTALASFPGSGNTWLRYLLQQVDDNDNHDDDADVPYVSVTQMLWRPQAFSAKDWMLEYSPLKEKDAEIFSPQATGISTGSVYKDFALLKNGFVPRIKYKQLWFIQLLARRHESKYFDFPGAFVCV